MPGGFFTAEPQGNPPYSIYFMLKTKLMIGTEGINWGMRGNEEYLGKRAISRAIRYYDLSI